MPQSPFKSIYTEPVMENPRHLGELFKPPFPKGSAAEIDSAWHDAQFAACQLVNLLKKHPEYQRILPQDVSSSHMRPSPHVIPSEEVITLAQKMEQGHFNVTTLPDPAHQVALAVLESKRKIHALDEMLFAHEKLFDATSLGRTIRETAEMDAVDAHAFAHPERVPKMEINRDKIIFEPGKKPGFAARFNELPGAGKAAIVVSSVALVVTGGAFLAHKLRDAESRKMAHTRTESRR